jgi:glycosyltransferase involved in cell wall biosynthesis
MRYQEIIFSIIIPHKNSPELLQRCLDSIPRRKDIQIIIVDDNSDENIVDFKNFPGLGEEYVEVYLTKEGKGAGYARNMGLEHVKGKWLLFADADDFFTENAFDYLCAEVDSPHEIIYFKVISCYSDTYEPADRDKLTNPYIDNFINKNKNAENRIRYKSIVPWGKMIKIDFVNRENIRFEEISAGNDVWFSLLAGHSANSINAINQIIYCVTRNKGGITSTLNIESLTTRYIVILRYNEFLRKKNVEQCQSSIIPFLYRSLKYFGIISFFRFLKLAIHYKNNPFLGIGNSLYVFFFLYRERIKKARYIVKN